MSSLDRLIAFARRTKYPLIVHDPTEDRDVVIINFSSFENLIDQKKEYDQHTSDSEDSDDFSFFDERENHEWNEQEADEKLEDTSFGFDPFDSPYRPVTFNQPSSSLSFPSSFAPSFGWDEEEKKEPGRVARMKTEEDEVEDEPIFLEEPI